MNQSDNLAALKRELLLRRLKASNAATSSAGPTLVRAHRSGPIPLSWSQQRLWFLDQLDKRAGAAYHMPVSLALKGDLDEGTLRRTLAHIIQRHEILRTRFPSPSDGPVQVISDDCELSLRERDLRRMPPAERASLVTQLVESEALTPFDLSSGPLIRGQLLRLADDEWRFLITQHHIISDGWSIGILVHEVREVYTALVEGRLPCLPPLQVQYADYAIWQRQWLAGDRLRQHMSFWRQRLAGAPTLLDLPFDRPRPAAQSYDGDKVDFRITRAVVEQLDALTQQNGATSFMALFAAWAVLLSRLSGQDDLVIGTPVANRQQTELEPLLGFFVNTLALRVRVNARETPESLLRQTKATIVSALAHQELPFSQVVEALQPQRNLGHNPIFQTMIGLQNTPSAGTLELPRLSLTAQETGYRPNHFDLTLTLTPAAEGYAAALEYSTALFDAGTVERIAAQYLRVLKQFVSAPKQSLGAITLRGPEDPAPFDSMNGPRSEPPLPMTLVHDVIGRAGEHTAVEQAGARWTYRDLEGHVARLRGALREQGVAMGDVVALHGGKSPLFIAACLAVMDIGAVMLPVDQVLPRGRRRALLDEARPKLVLALDSAEVEDLGAPFPRLVVTPTTLSCVEPCPAPPGGPAGESPAYIVFTSGTTGTPKGIVGSHRAISHFVRWESRELGVGAHDRVAQITTLSFDAMLRDIFLPLAHGGTVCLPTPRDLETPDSLLDWLEASNVTVVHTVPSVLSSWVAAARRDDPRLAALRLVCLAGEPLHGSLIGRWRETFPRARAELVNFYGPSETTMIKSFHRIGPDVSPGVVPVGRPLPDTQLRIERDGGESCAVGEVGEIVIRTAYATLGYLDGSSGGFEDDPATGDCDVVRYRTGDLGRYLADGTVAIGGRLDDQLKVRGVRVQPASVAAVIAAQPDIDACAVLPNRRGPEPELLAFVQTRAAVDEVELRRRLAEVLTAPETPQRFLRVEELPLAPNGKVDRAALLRLADTHQTPTYVPPATPTEVALASLWSELLGVQDIGRTYDFFRIGGHSLLAALARTRIRSRFGVDVPLRTFFESATLSEVSSEIDRLRAAGQHPDASSIVAIQSEGRRAPLFCVHPVTGGVYGYRDLAAALGPDQPVYGLEAHGLHEGTTPRTSVEEMAEAYLAEIRSLSGDHPVRLVGWSFGGLVAFEMARQLRAKGADVASLAIIDSRADGEDEWARLAGVAPDLKRVMALADLEAHGFARELVTDAEMARQLEVVSVHQRAAAAYAPAVIDVPILLLRLTDLDGRDSLPSLDGWRQTTTAEVRVVDVPGTHYSIMDAPAVDIIATALMEEG